MKKTLTFEEQKMEEQKAVSDFLEFFSGERNYDLIIYTDWTAKDVLGHVTSWHLSFARNLRDAVNNTKPTPFTGTLTDVNEKEVKKMSQYTVDELKRQMLEAQKEIDRNIGNSSVTKIAYKKGSRDYSPLEHLEIVQRHINTHLKDLRAKYT